MSMREYPIMLDAAFILDKEIAAYITFSMDKKENCVPDAIAALSQKEFEEMARDEALPEYYGDEELALSLLDVCFVTNFDGVVTTLFPERAKNPIDETYSEGSLYYIPADRAADLFEAAYASPDELLDEFKNKFSKESIEFPEDFDWWQRLVKISGTTYC